MKISQGIPVLYVEPNWVYKAEVNEGEAGNGTPDLMIPPEDYCMYVDLKAEVYSRGMASTSGKKTMVIEWVSKNDEDAVRFMSGSRIYVDSSKKDFFNSLTTNYTNTYYMDLVEGKQTNELFGISSIEIKYATFFVPEVTVNFVDIRGAALFGTSQLAHLKRVNNISGFRDPDVADSFFSCFFTFPYPKFTLMFKGFYGKPLSYELTCSNFKAKFDASTGNFNATATFVGYAYSFLSDISFNLLLCAPYSDCGGLAYWQKRVEEIDNDFFLYGENNEHAKMITMGELIVALDNVAERVKAETAGDPAIVRQGELEQKKEKLENILTLNQEYLDTVKNTNKYVVIQMTCGDIILLNENDPDEGNQLIFGNNDDDYIGKVQDAYDKVASAAKEFGMSGFLADGFKFKNYLSCKVLGIGGPTDKPERTVDEQILTKAEKWGRGKEEFKDDLLEKVRANENVAKIEGGGAKYNYGFYIYNLSGKIKEQQEKSEAELNQEIDENNEKVAAAEAAALSRILGFAPTAYNFCKIIFAHLETFVYLMYETVTKIYENSAARTPENLNMQDAETLSDFKVSETRFVPPFPQITKQETVHGESSVNTDVNGTTASTTTTIDNGNGTTTTIAEEWIGNVSGSFEEVPFINGLLNGAKAIGELMMKHAEAEQGATGSESGATGTSSSMGGISGRECALPNPVIVLDTVLNSKDFGPWGQIDFNRYDDFAGKVFIRMQQLFSYGKFNDAQKAAEADAKNFASKFSKVSGVVGDKLNGEHGFEEFLQIILGQNKEYQKDGTFAWEASSTSSYGIARKDGSVVRFNAFKTSDGCAILPTEGRSFKSINTDLSPTNDNPPKYKLPATYANYGFYTDKCLPDNGKTQNPNVFKIDVIGYADYGQYYQNSEVKSNTIACGQFNTATYLNSWFDEDVLKDGDLFYGDINKESMSTIADSAKLKTFVSSVGNRRGSLFGEKAYYNEADIMLKAHRFLKACKMYTKEFDKGDVVINNIGISVVEGFNFIPRCLVLEVGAQLSLYRRGLDKKTVNVKGSDKTADVQLYKYTYDTMTKKYRKEVIDALIAHFDSWSLGDFKEIDGIYSLGATRAYQDIDGDVDVDELPQYITKTSSFGPMYVKEECDYDKTSQSLELIFSESADTRLLVDSIFQPCALVTSCVGDGDGVPESVMNTYWNAFTDGIKDIAIGGSDDGSGETTSDMVGASNQAESEAPEDVKVALYHYCKVFFDKWVAGVDLDELVKNHKLGVYFDPTDNRNGRFHFIDSFYNDVGGRILVNPQTLLEDIMACQTQNGFTMMHAIIDFLSKNRFDLYCLENFGDLLDFDNFKDMFKPFPYTEMGKDDNISDFVALYHYEPSAHLDVEDGEYLGDGFMLNNADRYPYAIKHKDLEFDYPLPAFGVTYGMQYQNFFTSIEVGMEKPMVTEQSLKSQYLLAGAATDKTIVREYIPYGQDLFSIYSNNMYTCTVKMLGCAYVQPLMYFSLNNIPMFRGAYMIHNVSHSITPGHIETTFVGTRMAATANRIATNWIKKGYAPEAFYQENTFDSYGNTGGVIQSSAGGSGVGSSESSPTSSIQSGTLNVASGTLSEGEITKLNETRNIRQRTGGIKYIVIHYSAGGTSKPGAWKQTYDTLIQRGYSTDYMVDDGNVVQWNDVDKFASTAIGSHSPTKGTPEGAGCSNRNSVSIETSSNIKSGYSPKYPNHEGWYFTSETLNNLAKLCRYLIQKYNIPKSNIIRHFDINKKDCPGIFGWNTGKIYNQDGFNDDNLFRSFVDSLYNA